MSLPQEDTFMNRQNYSGNMGLIENPMGKKIDTSQNALFPHGLPNFDSSKPKHNFLSSTENNFKQRSQHKNASSGNTDSVNMDITKYSKVN